MSNISYPNKKTYVSGNLEGSGSLLNPIVLKDDISLNSVTASHIYSENDLHLSTGYNGNIDIGRGDQPTYEINIGRNDEGSLTFSGDYTDIRGVSSAKLYSDTKTTINAPTIEIGTEAGKESRQIKLNGNITSSGNFVVENNLTVNGTASINVINTIEATSLKIGDKYITILSGANNQADLDGAGILFGSGSEDGVTGDESSVAHIVYRDTYDKLEVFPGLRVSGSAEILGDITGSSRLVIGQSYAYGEKSVSFGWENTAVADYSFTHGIGNYSYGQGSHAEGDSTNASGAYSHAEGGLTKAIGNLSHAEGYDTEANGFASHAEGNETIASGSNAHSEGQYTTAKGDGSHAEGSQTIASGYFSHTEGDNTKTNAVGSHAEGYGSITSEDAYWSHAEGYMTITTGSYSHAEGAATKAIGLNSHAEGEYTQATGRSSHSEGFETIASGDGSHAEGENTVASISFAHAEGRYTLASGVGSHAEGLNTTASADAAHSEGIGTIANSQYQHVQGKYNQTSSLALMLVGNGASDSARSNILEVYMNQITVSGSLNSTNSISASNGFSGSLYGTASYATNSDLLDGFHASQFVTTGSNTFTGNQTITGSLYVSSVISGSVISGTLVGPAGGILTGSYPNPTGLVANNSGNILLYSGSNNQPNISLISSASTINITAGVSSNSLTAYNINLNTYKAISSKGDITLNSAGKVYLFSGDTETIYAKAGSSIKLNISSSNWDASNGTIALGDETKPAPGRHYDINIGQPSTSYTPARRILLGSSSIPVMNYGKDFRVPQIITPISNSAITVNSNTICLVPNTNMTMSAKPTLISTTFDATYSPDGCRVSLMNTSNYSICFENDTTSAPLAWGVTPLSSSLKLGAPQRVLKPWGTLELQFQRSGSDQTNSGYWIETNFSNNLTGSYDLSQYALLSGSIISASSLYTNYIDFNTSSYSDPPPPPAQIGRVFYNGTTGDITTYLNTNGLYLNNGQQLIQKCRNDTAFPFAKGTIVHITGATNSAVPYVEIADWTNDGLSANTLGITMETIAPSSTGYVIVQGVISEVNLEHLYPSMQNGQILYLSSSGQITNVKPSAPKHTVSVGQIVSKAGVGTGQNTIIYVSIQNGYELSELHDVSASNDKTNGDLLVWDSTNSVWKNTKILSGSYNVTGALTASVLLNGRNVQASGMYSHAEGYLTTASGYYSHAEGESTQASGTNTHSEGYKTIALGNYSHAEGFYTTASAIGSHTEGYITKAYRVYSHAEGLSSIASGSFSHAEGGATLTEGQGSHAEGNYTTASGDYSHTEGSGTLALAPYCHAEGVGTIASNPYVFGAYTELGSHAEGYYCTSLGAASHAEGRNTLADSNYSHAEGLFTTASAVGQHVQGKYNETSSTALMLIGNGTSDSARSNILEVYTDNVVVSGNLKFPNGNGIDFGITSLEGTNYSSNTILDDYEEGTWIPMKSSAPTTGSTTYASWGRYTKIGNIVHLYGGFHAGTGWDGIGDYISYIPYVVDYGTDPVYTHHPVMFTSGGINPVTSFGIGVLGSTDNRIYPPALTSGSFVLFSTSYRTTY